MENIEARVKMSLAEHFGQSVDSIKNETSLADLDADELDEIELVMSLEDEFGIRIDDEEMGLLKTVQQYIDIATAKTAVTA